MVVRVPHSKLFLLVLLGSALSVVLLRPPARASANALTALASISAGGFHTCAVTDSGGVKCWGNGEWGQLGDGTNGDNDFIGGSPLASIPVSVCQTYDSSAHSCQKPLSGAIAVSAGSGHTCALTTSGSVKCWGQNFSGALGVDNAYCSNNFGGQFPCSNTPVAVSGLDGGVAAIAAGDGHSCALMNTGGVKCWGLNTYGQLGDNTTSSSTTPVDVCETYDSSTHECSQPLTSVRAIAAGFANTCALMSDGRVKCWGASLGNGGAAPSAMPVDVIGLDRPVIALGTGLSSQTCVVLQGGGIKCWGGNSFGQLGNGTTIDSTTPVDVCQTYDSAAQQCLQPLSDMQAVSGGGGLPGGYFTCAVSASGKTLCWGSYFYGQLGDGGMSRLHNGAAQFKDAIDPTPIEVVNLDDAVAVAASWEHTCVATHSGGAKCWGYSFYSTLGDGGFCLGQCPIPIDVVAASGTKWSIGDANLDHAVDSVDALNVLQYQAQLIGFLPPSANANGDGHIDSLDALLILQFSAGLVSELPPPNTVAKGSRDEGLAQQAHPVFQFERSDIPVAEGSLR
jgi:alpha-tubulin suppressor-like RCC1 family protein